MVANKLTMTTTESRNHIELVLKVARMYYTDNLTQAQIAAQEQHDLVARGLLHLVDARADELRSQLV
jgi:hypothetical protein